MDVKLLHFLTTINTKVVYNINTNYEYSCEEGFKLEGNRTRGLKVVDYGQNHLHVSSIQQMF